VATAIERYVVSALNAIPPRLAAHVGARDVLARALRPVINVLVPPTAVVTIRSGAARGMRIAIDAKREKYYWTGVYEEPVQNAIAEVLTPGNTMWDIGAHAGFFSLVGANCVRRGGLVHAFEPQPENFARLSATVAANGLHDVIRVHRQAVSARSADVQLYGHPSTSMWSLEERGDAPALSVPAVTLDDLAASDCYGLPNLVKIDAEGAELDILRGGARLIEHGTTFLIELHGTEAADVTALLPHYRLRSLSERHWLARR